MPDINLIIKTVHEVMEERGLAPLDLTAESRLLGQGALDSLSLAEVVVRLEEKTGKDPFEGGFISFQTVGELALLYEQP